jgi:hypothetical protein
MMASHKNRSVGKASQNSKNAKKKLIFMVQKRQLLTKFRALRWGACHANRPTSSNRAKTYANVSYGLVMNSLLVSDQRKPLNSQKFSADGDCIVRILDPRLEPYFVAYNTDRCTKILN